jgi:hypothetical protein
MEPRILHTWDGVDQPVDEEIAGSPWLYISTYQEFHAGLLAARGELDDYSTLIAEIGLESSPYAEDENWLQWMINWGEQKLKENECGSPNNDIVL